MSVCTWWLNLSAKVYMNIPSRPKLVLVLHGSSDIKEVVCSSLADLSDYYQPHSPGALLKAAFVCADLVDLASDQSLAEQLMMRYGGGFELHSWTNLPHGSGTLLALYWSTTII